MTPPPIDTLTRGHKKKARTRQQLIDAAVDVVAEQGEAFSVSDVVAAAGVSNGTFYNYFDDREALIDALVPDILDTFTSWSDEVVSEDDPVVRFASVSALALARASSAPRRVQALLRLFSAQQAIIDGSAFDHLRADLDAGSRAGRFTTDSNDAAQDLVVATLLMASRRIIGGDADAEYPRRVITLLLQALGVPMPEAATVAREVTSSS